MSRLLSLIVRAAKLLPKQLDRLWLEAGLRSLQRREPMSPEIPYIVRRLSGLKE